MTVRRPRRHADRWTSSHERARILAARRLDGELQSSDQVWLDGHLYECVPCAEVAADYTAHHAALRALTADPPQPPRDLWARTAAAIERDAARGSRGARRARRPSPIPLGALSGALVAVVVVGTSLLAQGRRVEPPSVAEASSTPSATRTADAPVATPLIVAAGDVRWLRQDRDGGFGLYVASIGEVCPLVEGSACAPLDEVQRREISNVDAPSTVVLSPKTDQLVVVDDDADGNGGTMYVVPVAATGGPTSSPGPTAPSAPPTGSPAPNGSATPSSTATPAPSAPAMLPSPSVPPSVPPSGGPSPTNSGLPFASSAPPGTPPPSLSPEPSPDGSVAIASGIRLVGDSAAYSADGQWFAFSAEPAEGGFGPDVYLWHVGDAEARPLTSDHRSVLAAWFGDQLLVSRVTPAATPEPSMRPSGQPSQSAVPESPIRARGGGLHAETVLIDPLTGAETILDQVPFWRPTVDPTGTLAVYWEGTLVSNDAATDWLPESGRLVLGRWPVEIPAPVGRDAAIIPGSSLTPAGVPGASSSPATSPSAVPSASPTPRATRRPSASPAPAVAPGSVSPSGPPASADKSPDLSGQPLSDGLVLDWDARWDPSGRQLALWIADPVDPAIGRLSLFVVDPLTGRFDPDLRLLKDQPALPGFSLADGRLAWVTPPGQDGQASRVQVLAWTGDEVGSIETQGSAESILIIR